MSNNDECGASAPYESKVHKLADAAHRGACWTCELPVTSSDVEMTPGVRAHAGACADTARRRYAMGAAIASLVLR